MPRLRGRYDYHEFPRNWKIERHFGAPLEELSRRDPQFKQKWEEISNQYNRRYFNNPQEKEQAEKQAGQQIWREVIAALRRRQGH